MVLSKARNAVFGVFLLALVGLASVARAQQPTTSSSQPSSFTDTLDSALTAARAECGTGSGPSPRTGIISILSVGPAILPTLVERLKLLQDSQAIGDRALIIQSIGLLSESDDVAAVEALRANINQETFVASPGGEGGALLRIGGLGARTVLDYLATSSLDPYELQWILGLLWTLDDVEDLEYASRALERLAQFSGHEYVRVQIREDGLPRLRLAIQIIREPDSAETKAQLLQMVKNTHPAFISLSGGLSRSWALDKIVELGASELKGDLREYLDAASHLESTRQQLIRALFELGGSIRSSEEKFLLPTGVSYGRLEIDACFDVDYVAYLKGIRARRPSAPTGSQSPKPR